MTGKLSEEYDAYDKLDLLKDITIPPCIKDNLKYDLRPYQEKAFKRYIHYVEETPEGKTTKPLHLLYNMATGSGKTLIMAGLILYLYKQGYRNFLFFEKSWIGYICCKIPSIKKDQFSWN